MAEYVVWVKEVQGTWEQAKREPMHEFRFDAESAGIAVVHALTWFGLFTRYFELYAPGHVRIYVFDPCQITSENVTTSAVR